MTRRKENEIDKIRRTLRAARAPQVKEVRDVVKRAASYLGMARFLMEDGAPHSAAIQLARAKEVITEYLQLHPELNLVIKETTQP